MEKFIVVAGNIGSGKTTLVKILSERMGFVPFYEPHQENPYLADFYEDMERWSYHSQVYFLTQKLRIHRKVLLAEGSVVQDRSVYEDAEIFAILFSVSMNTKFTEKFTSTTLKQSLHQILSFIYVLQSTH